MLFTNSCVVNANGTYYRKTCQYLNIWFGEHSGVSPLLTTKKSKTKTTTVVKDHMLFWDHIVSLKDFKISEIHLKIKESLLIACDKPELNRNKKSAALFIWLMYSSSNVLFVQGLNIITLFYCFIAICKYCQLLFTQVSFNNIWRKYACKIIFFTYNGLIMHRG